MLIVQYGQAKSGSSFIFQILTDLLQNRFLNWSNYMKNRNSFVPKKYHNDYIDIMNDELRDIIGRIPIYEFFMFKTHTAPNQTNWEFNIPDSPSEDIQNWINDDELKIIATFRDPRDMSLSYLDHANAYRRGEKDFFENEIYSVFDAVQNVKNEYRILKYWIQYSGIHWISYDQICEKPFEILESIKRYIGLYNIDSSGFLEKLLDNRNKIHQYNKGYAGRWKKELSSNDAQKLTREFSYELEMFTKLSKRAEFSIKRI